MTETNKQVLFIGAICMLLYGGYAIIKAGYYTIAWDNTNGTVINFERNTWSCGRGVGECYALIVQYKANKKNYTITSNRKYDRNKPLHLMKQQIPVYYSSINPGDAILGGSYGKLWHGTWLFFIGLIILIGYWIAKKRES